jgi:hypothetical protein
VGDVKIPYYTTHQHPGRPKYGFWSPCLKRPNKKTKKMEPTLMAKLGFECVALGVDGPEAWTQAQDWNRRWYEARAAYLRGEPVAVTDKPEPIYPPCSIGEGFAKFRKTGAWLEGKKERTREDWWRGWKLIAPVFGDVDPRTIDLKHVCDWYYGDPEVPEDKGLLGRVGVRESHRAVKIWRALWAALGTITNPEGVPYVTAKDPSLGIRRKTPKGRTQSWMYDEVRVLVKGAWREQYHGLAAALCTLWDTMQSPVDVVSLTAGQRHRETMPAGAGKTRKVFQFRERTKTDAPAVIGTLSYKAECVLDRYIKRLGFELHDDTPIYWTRGGKPGPKGGRPRPPVPYNVDTLGKDFAKVRDKYFPGDLRQIIDFRRSGAIEAEAGQVTPKALGAKMNNTIETNPELQRTYLPRSGPQNAVLVQLADEARARGRKELRSGKGNVS